MKYNFAGVVKVFSRYSDIVQRLLLFTFLIFYILQSPPIILNSHAAPPAPVPQTGQTTSYAMDDDGALQPGVPWPVPRFSDNANGTVTDNLTGLIWLKNANCYGIQTFNLAMPLPDSLAAGACGLTDGSTAGQWRLPSRQEMLSLVNRKQADNSTWLTTQYFTSVQGGNNLYCSSSTYALDTAYYWGLYMKEGNTTTKDKGGGFCYVWPVRGGQ